MDKTKMIKTVKKKTIYDPIIINPSGKSYLKGSPQSSSRIRRRTILGEKFDYGEKIKEKQNYVLYVAGQGQEKKEIEEIEELPTNGNKKEQIVEQKQIIDNYQYHETKEIKKKHSRNSQTKHKRLCDPFERTTVKKYSSYTSEPKKGGYKIIRTTNIVDKNDYSMDYLHTNKNNKIKLNSLTTKPQQSATSRRIDSYTNISISSSTNESCKNSNGSSNVTQMNNRNRRPMSNGGRINNFSQYERKKVNGKEKVENYTSNQEKIKRNLLPQNTIKYTYDKTNDTIPKSKNYKYNRIPIDISKYNYTSKPRKNSTKIVTQITHEIKMENQTSHEQSLYEGPKYQLIGKDLPKDKPRPKTESRSRIRSNKVRKQKQQKIISNEKKGYIPFAGKGYRVGGNPAHIPRPNNNRNKIPKPNEDKYSSLRIERNSSYTEISQRNIGINNNYSTISNNSNIREMKDLNKESGNSNSNPNIRREINNTNYQKSSKSKERNQKNYDNKFPGKGIRVGSSGINRRELISENNNNISYAEYKKFEPDNMDTLEISGKKNENIKCLEQSLFYRGDQNEIQNDFEKTIEENLCFREENEENLREIFCPVHGRQVIRICD